MEATPSLTDVPPSVSVDNSSCQDSFTYKQCVALVTLRSVVAVLGIVASLFLIFVMWVSNKLTRPFYRILLFISVCNVVRNLVVAITIDGLTGNDAWCVLQGIFIQFCTWAIISWELCLTVHLYLNSINVEDSANRERIYHLVCWGTSLIFTIIPLAAWQYGPAITWCWIQDSGWRIAVLYAEYVVIILAVFVLYGKVIYGVCTVEPSSFQRQPDDKRKVEIYKSQVRPMILYPFVILIEGIVPISFRTQNLTNPHEKPFVFAALFTISVVLWGIPFVAVYVLDPVTRGEITSLRANCIKKFDKFRKSGTLPRQRRTTSRRPEMRDTKVISVISIEPTTVADLDHHPSTPSDGTTQEEEPTSRTDLPESQEDEETTRPT